MGIDPGAHTGIAVYVGGRLDMLETIEPWRLPEFIADVRPARVVFEDSRLESFVWTQAMSRPAALKMARNVGEVDAWCKLIAAICARLDVPANGVSPTRKGAKLDAKSFAQVTGWTGKCNEHTRDAAMVAWPFRSARS